MDIWRAFSLRQMREASRRWDMQTLSHSTGFTLIEALVAIMVLSIGIMCVYGMQISAIQGNSKANQISSASIAAQDTIERILGLSYSNVTSGNHDYGELGSVHLPTGVSSLTWTVNSDLSGNLAGLKKITVRAVYDGGGNVTYQFLRPTVY